MKETDSWVQGVGDAIAHVKARQQITLWNVGYRAALADVLAFLEAMLERGSRKSTTELAGNG